MDYKEKYEQAISRMNKWVEGSEIIDPKEVAEFVFPELKESNDERIRKELLNAFQEAEDSLYMVLTPQNRKSFITWLEKQGEPLCWIKCSDRLPNRDGIYLVVTDGSHNDVYDMAKYDSIEGWHKFSKVIYWMPIPQLNNKIIIEQKPAWSEEDEDNYVTALWHIKKSSGREGSVYNWLKCIKERMKGE